MKLDHFFADYTKIPSTDIATDLIDMTHRLMSGTITGVWVTRNDFPILYVHKHLTIDDTDDYVVARPIFNYPKSLSPKDLSASDIIILPETNRSFYQTNENFEEGILISLHDSISNHEECIPNPRNYVLIIEEQ